MLVAEAPPSSVRKRTKIACRDSAPEVHEDDGTASSMRSCRSAFYRAATKRLGKLVTDSPHHCYPRDGRRPRPLDWDGKSYTHRIAIVLQELFLLEAILPSNAEPDPANDNDKPAEDERGDFSSEYVVAYSAAARILGYDAQESRDIALDAMLKFREKYLHTNRYDPSKAKPSTLIFKIAANMAKSVRRRLEKEKASRVYIDMGAVPDREAELTLAPPSERFKRAVMKVWTAALEVLTKTQRLVMITYVENEFSLAKVAEVLDEKPGTVRVRVYRARLRLRQSRPLQKLAAELLAPVGGEF